MLFVLFLYMLMLVTSLFFRKIKPVGDRYAVSSLCLERVGGGRYDLSFGIRNIIIFFVKVNPLILNICKVKDYYSVRRKPIQGEFRTGFFATKITKVLIGNIFSRL